MKQTLAKKFMYVNKQRRKINLFLTADQKEQVLTGILKRWCKRKIYTIGFFKLKVKIFYILRVFTKYK